MPPKKSAAKSELAAERKQSRVEAQKKRAQAALEKRLAKEAAQEEALSEWLRTHDELIDKVSPAVTISEFFSKKLSRKTFSSSARGIPEQPYDWTALRNALESRTAKSRRWFLQVREEDLLLEPDGLEGVTLECVVIVEASRPTLAPAHYVVKEHWPFSDVEDNAPEQIMEIAQQGMAWVRLTRDNGGDINAFVLQRPVAAAPTASVFDFGTSNGSLPAPASAAASAPASFGFGFGSAAAPAQPPASPPASFGFGNATATSQPAVSAPISFGFGNAAPTSAAPPSFGFQQGGGAPKAAAPAVPSGFGFGSGSAAAPPSLKPGELCFTLWSNKRLREMQKDLKSGSRIVIEDYAVDDTRKIKLVMQNDQHDDVKKTTKNILIKRIFAKENPQVASVDKWIDNCPEFDPKLMDSLQTYRAKFLTTAAEESEEFQELFEKCHAGIETTLSNVVNNRKLRVKQQLKIIDSVMKLLKEKKLAEKADFHQMKYYASNSVLPFRPFGKISGISEMGESVDTCIPPAYVPRNALLARRE